MKRIALTVSALVVAGTLLSPGVAKAAISTPVAAQVAAYSVAHHGYRTYYRHRGPFATYRRHVYWGPYYHYRYYPRYYHAYRYAPRYDCGPRWPHYAYRPGFYYHGGFAWGYWY